MTVWDGTPARSEDSDDAGTVEFGLGAVVSESGEPGMPESSESSETAGVPKSERSESTDVSASMEFAAEAAEPFLSGKKGKPEKPPFSAVTTTVTARIPPSTMRRSSLTLETCPGGAGSGTGS